MTAAVIDGLKIAQQMQAEIAQEVQEFRDRTGVQPALCVFLMGDNPASRVYVRKKQEACEKVGIVSYLHHRDPRSQLLYIQSRIEREIKEISEDENVHGILIQLPLPERVDQYRLFDLIDPRKDVDVFHPENVGLLMQGRPRLKPCTPAGIVEMLKRSGINLPGKKVAVINRSNVVGKPLSSMLIQDCDEYANATVTVCHNKTPPDLLKAITKTADIVVVAVGIPGFLTADMVSPGQVIVDVGTNRLTVEGKNKLVGDVDYGPVSEIVAAISPVPGGVGPMTVTMLLRNLLEAAKLQVK